MKIWTRLHNADGDVYVSVYVDRLELLQDVNADAVEAADMAGVEAPKVSLDIDVLSAFIEEFGWKVREYRIDEHEVALPVEVLS